MSHLFGDLLGELLHRKHGLSQFKLARGIDQPSSVISEMCQGKRLTGLHARGRVVSAISWLHQQEALFTKEEANALLEAAGMAPLQKHEKTEARLLQQLQRSTSQHLMQYRENISNEFPPPCSDQEHSTTAPRYNLPVPPTPLIDRESEVAEIRDILNRPDCRLLTLTGEGGIGKTRLAIQAATQLAAKGALDFPNGIFFVALQLAAEPAFLARAIIDAIGMPISGTDDPRKGLIQFLQEQKMLLLLDNFEEVLQSPAKNTDASLAFLAEMIQQVPGVKVLITSRAVLNMSSEWIYRVQGLSYPAAFMSEMAVAPTLDDLSQFPAIRLFIDRAKKLQHNFCPADELDGIIQICQVVEGLPLAIEIAAAWTKMMHCAEIAAEIRRSLVFLEARYQDIPTRHRSILAVINHSWQALHPEERQVYARLSVFQGGFHRAAAEQVAGANVSILATLVDKSLLHWGPDDCYHFHELLRRFAHDQLLADPQAAREAHVLHCMYYTNFLHEHSAAITGPCQQEVLYSIMAELRNIRAAWRQALDDTNLATLAAYTYSEFCDLTSHYLKNAQAFE